MTETHTQPEDQGPQHGTPVTRLTCHLSDTVAEAVGAEVTQAKAKALLRAHCGESGNTMRWHGALCAPELQITSYREHRAMQVEYQIINVYFEHVSGILIL